MMRKELLNTVFKKPQTVGKIIQKLFNQRIKKWKKMQDAYDNETKHSTVVEKQLAWEEDVKNLLASVALISMSLSIILRSYFIID